MSRNPKEFYGTEGAVDLLSWFESVNSKLSITKCAEGNKVEYTACLLQGRALTWWNAQVQTRGREAANGLSWENFKKLLTEEYCRKYQLARMVPHMVFTEKKRVDHYIWGLVPEVRRMVTSSNPITLQDVVGMAYRLTKDVVRSSGVSKGNDSGRKRYEDQQRNRGHNQQDKRQRVTKNYGVVVQEPRPNAGPYPKCARCNLHHLGNCPKCDKCKQTGHLARNCHRAACYKCGSFDHLKNICPRLNRAPNKNNNNNAGNQRASA
ncbi:zinc finger, CCHC-type, retrotransposon gag domain protein [Tanacetum coccineum]|uniref:Zinc finger, CCHC-type, retrotransposon gag domain protein n=1 Tax=Tanacetum coccineum TaxID=301880 RepID=A0ABQ5ALB8_9ASTR